MPVFLRWLLRLAPLNPIAVRLVQNGSRRAKHFYVRTAYLGVLIIVLLWTLLAQTSAGTLSYRELAAAGAASFTYIAYLQIGLICVLAPVFMAGAIAQESSPRTWEILLTTPLTAMQIVLGNLLGRLFFILALLAASLPLFAVTQYFGGVPGRSIFASYLIAACAAVLVGTIAISLSVSRLVGRRAVFAFYVSVVTYIALTAGIDAWLRAAGAGVAGKGVTSMTALNPFLALRAMLEPTGYPRAPAGSVRGLGAVFLEAPVRTWCVGSGVLSLVLVSLSTLTVRSGGIQSIGADAGVPWYRRMFGLGRAGAEHRPPRHVWTNPIAWREAAARNATLGRILARWSFITLGGFFGLGLIVAYHVGTLSHSDFRLALRATTWGELAITALIAINMAATAVSREREDGTLDLLLTTPMTASGYIAGKLRGLIAYLLPLLAVPVGTLGVAGAYVGLNGLERAGGVMVPASPGSAVSIPVVLPEAGPVAALAVVPFIAFCVMVGLMWSTKSKGTLASVVSTVGIVGAVAGVVGLCAVNAGADAPFVGPILAGLSPATAAAALVSPETALASTVSNGGPISARIALAIGAVVSAVLYSAVVYGMHASIVRTFDVTVRKLAGTK